MKNKELKQEMIKNGKYSILKKFDKELYKNYKLGIKDYINGENEEEKSKNKSELIYELIKKYGIEFTLREINAYIQINNNKRQKSCRLKNHISYYMQKEYNMVFATFTFNEDTIKKDKKYRKETITRTLNKNINIIDYIGNVDYGEENGREHYHYILILKKDFEPKTKINTIISKKIRKFNEVTNLNIEYKYGFTTYELIGKKDKDRDKIKNYITKITLHGMKQKERNQLITKRNSPYHEYLKYIKKHMEEKKEAKENRKKFIEMKKIRQIEKEYQMNIEQIKRLS